MMESEDSDDSTDGPQYSAIIQPTLIAQLKKILDEYPDDGQILKEIIQNAEDAEATEMKIIYDERGVNLDEESKSKPFKKYFKGPALCVYNDAIFTEDDWQGIQMINRSNKEFDKTKIGRFGLGFKSVFHITDYPMIISGNKMLIIDPHQPLDRVCIEMKLNKMHKCTKQLDVSYCFNAFRGLPNFSEETLTTGQFQGTLFRFPLRREQTELSDNIYNTTKMLDLFVEFQSEASVELLFLKCLEKIELFINKNEEVVSFSEIPMYSVRISDRCIDTVRSERSSFQSYMKSVGEDSADTTKTAQYKMVIVAKSTSESESEREWFVFHCLKGGEMSNDLLTLSQDKSLSYSPYVSIAVPLDEDADFKGHVFCSMPLPLEDFSLTGFPVHVNGYFALSQNRRHVKWPSADQTRHQTHTDKAIKWNQCLLTEVLAPVYNDVIRLLIETCKNNGNPEEEVCLVYRSIPHSARITSHWDQISEPLFSQLFRSQILFTSKNGGQWVKPENAVFQIFPDHASLEMKETIIRLMKQYKIDLVDVSPHVVSTLRKRNIPVQTLTQDFIADCLRSNSSYTNLTWEEKKNILEYICSDGTLTRLNGLLLLPTHNGGFQPFQKRRGQEVIVCLEDARLFPGQEEKFIKQNLPEKVYKIMSTVAEKGLYQLSTLQSKSPGDVAKLLQTTIHKYIGATDGNSLQWNLQSPTSFDWLKCVWRFLSRYDLQHFSHLHLIPTTKTNELFRLSNAFILMTRPGYTDIPSDVCRCLQYLDIVVLESVPQEVEQHSNVRNYVMSPSVESVDRMLDKVQTTRDVHQLTKSFNDRISCAEQSGFVDFISGYTRLSGNTLCLLKSLALFTGKNSQQKVSVNKVNCVADTRDLPVRYYKESLDVTTKQQQRLVSTLGVPHLGREDVVIDILTCLRNSKQYNIDEKSRFMQYLFDNIGDFHSKDKMIQIARNVEFVFSPSGHVKKASDFFDPEDENLRLLILDNDQFPVKEKLTVNIKVLKKLGLKSVENLTAEILLHCARYIENNINTPCTLERSKKLVYVLNQYTELMHKFVEGSSLKGHLLNIRFVSPSSRRDGYPSCLQWSAEPGAYCRPADLIDSKYARLVGSVKPLLPNDISQNVMSCFGLNKEPVVQDVVRQLFIITENYSASNKPDLLPVVFDIYRFLASHLDVSCRCQELQSKPWILVGNEFQTPGNVCLNKQKTDINLEPYLFHLPPEFHTSELLKLFSRMDCITNQNTHLLIKVQYMIREKYKDGGRTKSDVSTDMSLLINILNVLKDAHEDDVADVLFPVKQFDNTRIVLKPAKECNYSKDDDDDFVDAVHFIHPDISPDTAITLGVPSLTDSLLEDAERLEEWGQTEPLTRRIKDLLKVYKDGLSVPKEIIQNADDAGASKVCFMYDEREKESHGKSLLDKNMMECQGPTLWAYNNAKFSEDDLRNITKVSGATKQADSTKIGKFGLGFCSVYNLTEVPSFVTGHQMVIFDPHYKYLGDALRRKKQPGLKIDLQRNRKVIERKSSQFEPFNNVFGCNLSTQQDRISFDGTLFRLPLRTRQQSATSEISETTYDRKQMESLIKIFIEAGGNLLLFTQNVTDVEFYHLPRNEKNPKNAVLLFSVKRHNLRAVESPIGSASSINTFSVLKDLSTNIENIKTGKVKDLSKVEVCHLLDIDVTIETNARTFGIKGSSSTTSWIVTWASGTGNSKTLALQSPVEGLLPLGSIACPIEKQDVSMLRTLDLSELPFGFYKSSHVFCFLPLPVETNFPVHINGSFAVTSDRRRLSCKTTDDKESFDSEWNEALICDAVCNAYILLLTTLCKYLMDKNELYYKLWPIKYGEKDSNQGNFHKLQRSFYQNVCDEQKNIKVFRRDDKITSIKSCQFLDPALMESKFGEKAFQVCIALLEDSSTTMIVLPQLLRICFRDTGCESIIKARMLTPHVFYSKLVFPYLTAEVWNDETIDLLLLYAIDNCSEKMTELLQSFDCIPTMPKRLLRSPSGLVDRNGQFGEIFSVEDERFIISDENAYNKPTRISTLMKLGMISNSLPDYLIIDRAKSIQSLATVCSTCALNRCANLVRYLNGETATLAQNKQLLEQLKGIPFLPVKCKPKDWAWPWASPAKKQCVYNQSVQYVCQNARHASSSQIRYECPINLYLDSVEDLVFTVHPLLDKGRLPFGVYTEFWTILGVKQRVSPNIAFENLLVLSRHASSNNKTSTEIQALSSTTMATYRFLNDHFKKEDGHLEGLSPESYVTEKIILLNDILVKPYQVFGHISEDCSPVLYSLNSPLRKFKDLFKFLGIEDVCSPIRILTELDSIKIKYGNKPMEEQDIRLYVKLLKVLGEILQKNNLTEDALQKLNVPDTKGVLHPIQNVCIDEINVNSTEKMHFTHASISHEIANAIGIQTKREMKVAVCTKDLFSKDFGQHEELITRINRILTGYPCDVGVLKEMVQNADDAKATEVHIILDWTEYATDGLFSDTWKPLQGPAILVFNNSCFSKTDIDGIQSLGIGSKSNDPTKTGQYGVGFNAVYHLTDVPSFLTRGPEVETGEVLCVMDPHCRYVPKATEASPGRKYVNTKILKEDHPNVFICYHESLLKENGTIFRLPLRTSKFTPFSKLSGNEITMNSIKSLLMELKEEMSEMLLFVNNVKTIKMSEVVDGKLQKIYSVESELSEDDKVKRENFQIKIDEECRILQKNHTPDSISVNEVTYEMHITDCDNKTRDWLVVRRLGFSGKSSPSENIVSAYKTGDIGLLPRGGVALPLRDDCLENFHGRVYCFLPLPLRTNLPVHINGHFALDHEARRNLWTDEHGGFRTDWNDCLLGDVIAPAYSSALQSLKEIKGLDLDEPINGNQLKIRLKEYHSLFPDLSKTKTDYERTLIKSLYKWIYENEMSLFPSCKLVSRTEARVHMYPLESSRFEFPCIFNNLQKQQTQSVTLQTVKPVKAEISRIVDVLSSDSARSAQKNRLSSLVQICKDLGVKLLESPYYIFQSIQNANLQVTEMTPDFLIDFLKSFNSAKIDKCNLVDINLKIEDTTFKKVYNLIICIEYCQKSDTFDTQIDGLPLCLSEDGVLRTFDRNSSVFYSKYSDILKESARWFLHHELLSLFTAANDGIHKFGMKEFSEYLPYTLSPEKYRTHNTSLLWEPKDKAIPNKTWILNVWKFINATFAKENLDQKDPNIMIQFLSPILPWCLVPCFRHYCTSSEEDVTQSCLFPITDVRVILNDLTFTGSLRESLKGLSLPCFNTTIFDNDVFTCCSILETLLVSNKNPTDVVEYLHANRDEIINRDVKQTDCVHIMEYLAQHVDDIMKQENNEQILDKIRGIPLHLTSTGHNISLNSNFGVLVLDSSVSKEIPSDGIEEWAATSKTILLRTTFYLTKLYAVLGFTREKLGLIDIYANHLLPKFNHLPQPAHLTHLTFIRDKLLAKSVNFDEEQINLINILKNVAFISNADDTLYKASHFLSPFNELMKCMCDPEDFPTEPFTGESWKDFLRLCGMQTDISTEMVIKFASAIETLGGNGITEEVKIKSEMLVKHILRRNAVEKENLLSRICSIKFIVPFIVSDWRAKIFCNKETALICYANSVPSAECNLCWTTCALLPWYANPRSVDYLTFTSKNEISNQLQISMKIPSKLVVNHIQNVCDALKTMSEEQLIDDSEVYMIKKLMIEVYDWLTDNLGIHGGDFRRFLCQKPVIFIPGSKLFLTCDKTVKHLAGQKEIKPYLMGVPDEYGKYFKLFEVLGMNGSPTIWNYVKVMEYLKTDVGNTELHINQLTIVRQALQQLVYCLPRASDENIKALETVDALYLITRDKTLENASGLVLSDNEEFEEKIGAGIKMPYVLDFEELQVLTFGNLADDLRKLPKKLRPNILSDMISRNLDENILTRQSDARGMQLREFLSSSEFKQGVVRIIVHCKKRCQPFFRMSPEDVNSLLEGIDMLDIVQVEALVCSLEFEGTVVGQTDTQCFYQAEIRDEQTEHVLYCSFQELDLREWIIENSNIITQALNACTNNKLVDTGLLLKLFTYVEKPSGISRALDKEYVLPYSISNQPSKQRSVFPQPGTTVNTEWHRYLNNSFSDFDIDEYVALLLIEESMEGDRFTPAIYIYAIVTNKLDTTSQIPIIGTTLRYYEVDVGNGRTEKKRAYDLYKFSTSRDTSNEIVAFLNISEAQSDDRALDDILKEVKDTIKAAWTLPEDERRKIIKRLYKKWHPDKNHDNETKATEVFKYLKQIVIKMENGIDVDSTTYDSRSDFQEPRNSTFSAHFRSWERDTEKDSEYMRQNEEKRDRPGSRRQPHSQKVPSEPEARQWLRQAKTDYTAAEEFLPHAETGPHFNWICIMCCQSVEKAMKALYYNIDSNNVPTTNDLRHLLSGLSSHNELGTPVARLIELIGPREKLMYPDRLTIRNIPADTISRQTAEKARDITSEILELVSNSL